MKSKLTIRPNDSSWRGDVCDPAHDALRDWKRAIARMAEMSAAGEPTSYQEANVIDYRTALLEALTAAGTFVIGLVRPVEAEDDGCEKDISGLKLVPDYWVCILKKARPDKDDPGVINLWVELCQRTALGKVKIKLTLSHEDLGSIFFPVFR